LVRGAEVNGWDGFVEQMTGIECTQVVAPTIASGRDDGVKLNDVRQKPTAIGPRWRIVAETRKTLVLLQEGEDIVGADGEQLRHGKVAPVSEKVVEEGKGVKSVGFRNEERPFAR